MYLGAVRSTRPHDHGDSCCHDGNTCIGERRGHDDGQRQREVQDDHRNHRDERKSALGAALVIDRLVNGASGRVPTAIPIARRS